jgi:hypothetical protein
MIEAGSLSARTIPPTAPLYAEMSQLLSDARKNFEEGRVLLDSPRTKAEGTRKLNSAKISLAKVKLVYPMNEEAGILDLRIDSILDPNFYATLNTKISGIINRTRTGSQGSRIPALNELRDYANVFPDARNNWRAILFQAEIDAGTRPRPATIEEIEEARQIAAMARAALASGNIERIQAVQPELVKATALDRENQEVKRLLEQSYEFLRIVRLVLPYDAERLYQQASQALIQQDKIRAQQYLNQIYGMNSDFRKIQKVRLLQQRVDTI